MANGPHSTWQIRPEYRADATAMATRLRMEFARTVHSQRSALGWSCADLARRTGLTEEDIEAIEESAVDPTLDLVGRLSAALDSATRTDPGPTP